MAFAASYYLLRMALPSISEPIPYFKLAHSKGLTLPLTANQFSSSMF